MHIGATSEAEEQSATRRPFTHEHVQEPKDRDREVLPNGEASLARYSGVPKAPAGNW